MLEKDEEKSKETVLRANKHERKGDLWGTMGYETRERAGALGYHNTFSIFRGNLLNKTIIFFK